MYDAYLNHARTLYTQAAEADGPARRRLLREALNILSAVPAGTENRDELAARLEEALRKE